MLSWKTSDKFDLICKNLLYRKLFSLCANACSQKPHYVNYITENMFSILGVPDT